MKERSVRGGAFTIGAQAARFFLHTGSIAVLARLLTPEDFGLIAMITSVSGFMAMFKDMGLSMATVQRDRLTHEQISNLFWINVGLSLVIAVIVALMAPAIAWFYGKPELIWLTVALSAGFIFGGLATQHFALLNRQMRFGTLAALNIGGLAVGAPVGILAALAGAGVWSLVFMNLAQSLFGMVAVWLICRWRPGLPKRRTGTRSLLAFGGNLTGFNFVNYFARNLDNILIGKFSGPLALGLYNKAYSLLLMPISQINSPVTNVALPALSCLQNEPDRFRNFYKKGVFLIAFIGMPLVSFCFAAADSIILTVLGSQWTHAILIFRLLAPAAFIGSFNVATGWIYVSLGYTNRQFRIGILCSLITTLGFAIGVHWGAVGVALSLSIVSCILLYPRLAYCFKPSPLKVRELLEVLWRPAATSLIACALVILLGKTGVFDRQVVVGLGLKAACFALFYLLGWCLIPRGRQSLYEILDIVKSLGLFKRRRKNT